MSEQPDVYAGGSKLKHEICLQMSDFKIQQAKM